MFSNSNPVANSCCALVYMSLCLIVKSELISTKSFPQRRLRSQDNTGNSVWWLLVPWTPCSCFLETSTVTLPILTLWILAILWRRIPNQWTMRELELRERTQRLQNDEIIETYQKLLLERLLVSHDCWCVLHWILS